jgi:PQQ-like domain
MRRAHSVCSAGLLLARLGAFAVLVLGLSAYDWPQFGFNSLHSSNNTQESVINASNVSSLQRFLHVSLPSTADGAPAFLSNVVTISGTMSLVFVTTKAGHIMALDWRTGATVWSHQNNAGPNYTTSSPAIDPNRRYVYSYGLDGHVHKYQVGDGHEIIDGNWPELTTRKPSVEKGSSALSIATARNGTSYLYVTNGGYPGDAGDYQGHVTAINLSNGAQHVFNTMCSDQTVHFVEQPGNPDCSGGVQSAIWARPGVIYDPDTDKIYMATGNGTYTPASHEWGDTVFSLNPDGTGSGGNPLDTYTPTNFQDLQNGDADLGSTAPAILPNTSQYPHVAVQGGKDAVLRLLNLDNLSGHQPAGPGFTGGEVFSTTVEQGGEILTMPAVWVNPSDSSTWVFVANGNGLSGLKLSVDIGDNPSLVKMWKINSGGTSPIVANGVLYYVAGANIWGLDPVSHAQLWNNNQIGSVHWESPIVVNGLLYVTDDNHFLSGYSLNGAVPAPLKTLFIPFIQR